MLVKGPGIQKVIKPKTMNINFLNKSNPEDRVAPELGVLSMYDLKPWEANHNEQNLLKLGKYYKPNLSYREAMEILDDSLTTNQDLMRKTFKNRNSFSLSELGNHYFSLLPNIFRYSRHLTEIDENEVKNYRTGERNLEEDINGNIAEKFNEMNKDC